MQPAGITLFLPLSTLHLLHQNYEKSYYQQLRFSGLLLQLTGYTATRLLLNKIPKSNSGLDK